MGNQENSLRLVADAERHTGRRSNPGPAQSGPHASATGNSTALTTAASVCVRLTMNSSRARTFNFPCCWIADACMCQ